MSLKKFQFAVYQKWNPTLHGYSTEEQLEYLQDKFILILYIDNLNKILNIY